MSYKDLVQKRRSVRGFHRDQPIDEKEIREILSLCQRAPSNCNVQPWRVWVLSGAARDRLSDALCARLDAGDWGNPEDPIDTFHDEYRRLQVECAVEMYGAMGVGRKDMEGRVRAQRRNFEFFDAPHVAIVAMEAHYDVGVSLDIGTWLQTFMLALVDRGLASCPQAAIRLYPDVVRKEVGIADDMRILCGISFGYEDPSVPANAARQKREPLTTNVQFLS